MVSRCFLFSRKIKSKGGVIMLLIPTMKQFLITKTILKFDLSRNFVMQFINEIDKNFGLNDYLDNLEKSNTYNDLFKIYYNDQCVIRKVS